MPLILGTPKPVSSDQRRAIGIWMSVKDKQPIAPVRVFVTYEALRALDPSRPPDLHAAFDIFDANRQKIELAASRRFDGGGADDGDKHEGQPVITLRSKDLV